MSCDTDAVSLTGHELCMLNWIMRGHAEHVCFVRFPGPPMLLLAGHGTQSEEAWPHVNGSFGVSAPFSKPTKSPAYAILG